MQRCCSKGRCSSWPFRWVHAVRAVLRPAARWASWHAVSAPPLLLTPPPLARPPHLGPTAAHPAPAWPTWLQIFDRSGSQAIHKADVEAVLCDMGYLPHGGAPLWSCRQAHSALLAGVLPVQGTHHAWQGFVAAEQTYCCGCCLPQKGNCLACMRCVEHTILPTLGCRGAEPGAVRHDAGGH